VVLTDCAGAAALEFEFEETQKPEEPPAAIAFANVTGSAANASLGNASVVDVVREGVGQPDPEDLPDLAVCLGTGQCTVESTAYGNVEGQPVNYTSEMISFNDTEADSLSSADFGNLPPSEQEAIFQELNRSGFLETLEAKPARESSEADPADDEAGAVPEGSAHDAAAQGGGNASLGLLVRSEQLAAAPQSQRHRVRGLAKDYTGIDGKRARNDFAKTTLATLLGVPQGPCLDAVDILVGTSQEMYACFKEPYSNLRSAFCDPVEKHDQVRDVLTTVHDASQTLERLSTPLQPIPYVGPVARLVRRASNTVNGRLPKYVQLVERLRVQLHNQRTPDNECCPPFQTRNARCRSYPNWQYKCGACSAGEMCQASRACETLKKLEEKIDYAKSLTVDPMLEHVTKFAELANTADNSAAGSFLAGCGLSTCSDVKKAAESFQAQVRAAYWDKVCPLPQPSLPSVDLGILAAGKDILRKISDALSKVMRVLTQKRCIEYPRSSCWTERECTRVCIPCCDSRRRRRWWPSVSCRTCCHNVCVHLPKCRFWMDKVCFTAEAIIKGLHGLLSKLFGPIMKEIQRLINTVLGPIQGFIDSLIDKILSPLAALDGLSFNLDVMSISFPDVEPSTCPFWKQALLSR